MFRLVGEQANGQEEGADGFDSHGHFDSTVMLARNRLPYGRGSVGC
jgi:hypothetical protein